MAGSIGDPKRDASFTGLIAMLGVVAGVLLWILTIVLSRSNISGNGWALSGNGALIIPFGIGPAVVAGGWTAIILRMRGHRRWLQLGIANEEARRIAEQAGLSVIMDACLMIEHDRLQP